MVSDFGDEFTADAFNYEFVVGRLVLRKEDEVAVLNGFFEIVIYAVPNDAVFDFEGFAASYNGHYVPSLKFSIDMENGALRGCNGLYGVFKTDICNGRVGAEDGIFKTVGVGFIEGKVDCFYCSFETESGFQALGGEYPTDVFCGKTAGVAPRFGITRDTDSYLKRLFGC